MRGQGVLMSMLKCDIHADKISFNVLLALSLAIHITILAGALLFRSSKHLPLPQLQGITVEIKSIDFPDKEVNPKDSELSIARPATGPKRTGVATSVPQAEINPPATKAEMPFPAKAKTVLTESTLAAVPQPPAIQPQAPVNRAAAAVEGKAGPVATQAHAIDREYTARVRELIDREKEYPLMARKSGTEGTVYIKFVLARDGSLKQAEVSRSSGRRILDKAALNAVSAVRRFPHFPASMEGAELNFELPLTYKITGH